MTATVPCSFRWFSVRNGITIEAQQFKGNTYICEPADVGCMLQVEITVLILLIKEFRSIVSRNSINVIWSSKIRCFTEKRNINCLVSWLIKILYWHWIRKSTSIMSTKNILVKNNH